MNASQLAHRITFFEYAQANDGAGGTMPTRRDFYSTNAKVTHLKQSRTVQGNQERLTGGYEIYINWRPDMTPQPDWFVDYKGKLLTVTSVVDVNEERKWWHIIAVG